MTGVDALLNGDLVRRAFVLKSAGAGVEALVVFANDDEVHVFRPFVLERAILGAIKFHGAEVDVLLQFETQAQQNPLFENPGLDLRMADGAEKNRLELAQLRHRAVRQRFAGFEVTVAAEIVWVPVEFEAEFFAGGFAHLERFAGDFRTGAVAADDCNVVAFHKLFLSPPQKFPGQERAMLMFSRAEAMEF